MDDNEAIVKRVLDDAELQGALKGLYASRVYQRARSSSYGHAGRPSTA